MLGSGSWGSALAIQLSSNHKVVNLWGRNANKIDAIKKSRSNENYLPRVKLPENIEFFSSIEHAISNVETIIIAVPSSAIRQLFNEIFRVKNNIVNICWATKGIEVNSCLFTHAICEEIFGKNQKMAVISGPSFAIEVAEKKPTALTVASNSKKLATKIATSLSNENFRAYTSEDMVGVGIGGTVKNIIAIGAGISDGLNLGENAKIALINRGLKEMQRLGIALGADKETFLGLSGVGDLFLTCTSNLSRNRMFGIAVANGLTVTDHKQKNEHIVEGIDATSAVYKLSSRMNISMPICETIYEILFEDLTPKAAAKKLMSRAIQQE
ncbi:MAG: NAD(P)H-dependent glycerol-3-phosphate dehydrogenase [Woeseiaceae bacterium]